MLNHKRQIPVFSRDDSYVNTRNCQIKTNRIYLPLTPLGWIHTLYGYVQLDIYTLHTYIHSKKRTARKHFYTGTQRGAKTVH